MALTSALPTLYEYYTGTGISTGLSVDKPYFTLNDKNITLYSGAMHYFRVPRQYWRDRLRKLRAAGLNTVETYVPWNLHEPQNGHFDFGDGQSDMQDFLDIREYLKTAQEEDLFVILRPGPYICAEWEWGGLPSWLLNDDDVRIRTSEPKFMNYVERYFRLLFSLLVTFQFTHGGPIIAVQVENEYGSSPQRDLVYVQRLIDIMHDSGVVELLVSSDSVISGTSGTIPELLYQTVNFGSIPMFNLDLLKAMQPDKPFMVMEFWTGWYDHWSEIHHTTANITEFQENLRTILTFPASVNMYMFHGGTNWGFLNGANIGIFGNRLFSPTTTSYDYDAPLSEAGDYTEKYDIVKKLLGQYNEVPTFVPEQPELKSRAKYDDVVMEQKLNLNQILNQIEDVVQSDVILPMEKLPINGGSGQSYGYIVYRKENLDLPADSRLKIAGYVYDTVVVLVNGKIVSAPLTTSKDLSDFGYWRIENSSIVLTSVELKGATLDLVVENWGRGNFGYMYDQRKGLRDIVLLNEGIVEDWKIFPLEFKKAWILSLGSWETFEKNDFSGTGPALFKGTLNVENEPSDTFIDLQEWTKGCVIVNGFVLGKYARIGPQQTLYLPGPFLRSGKNDIIVFEQFIPASALRFSVDPIFNTL